MSDLVRLSFSIDRRLSEQLERLMKQSGYSNRSEFVRDLIRDALVRRDWKQNQAVVGTITLLYDHHAHRLPQKLTDAQHDHHSEILATTHVHLDHDHCVEMILVKGRASRLRAIADKLRKYKGVLHSELSMSSLGRDLK